MRDKKKRWKETEKHRLKDTQFWKELWGYRNEWNAEDAHWKIFGFYWIYDTFATWQKEKSQKVSELPLKIIPNVNKKKFPETVGFYNLF